jgi:hypothetical protein
MNRVSRLVLVSALAIAASWLSAPNVHASGWCQIWCDNGRVVSGGTDSYGQCLQAALANCDGGGGTFCYTGEPCQTW